MAEVVGLAASIVAIVSTAATAAKFASTVLRIAREVGSTREDLRWLGIQVNGFSATTEMAYDALRPHLDDISKSKSLTYMDRNNRVNRVIDEACWVRDALRRHLPELREIKYQSRLIRFFNWKMMKPDIRELGQRMECVKNSLMLLVNVVQLEKLQTCDKEKEAEIKRLKRVIELQAQSIQAQESQGYLRGETQAAGISSRQYRNPFLDLATSWVERDTVPKEKAPKRRSRRHLTRQGALIFSPGSFLRPSYLTTPGLGHPIPSCASLTTLKQHTGHSKSTIQTEIQDHGIPKPQRDPSPTGRTSAEEIACDEIEDVEEANDETTQRSDTSPPSLEAEERSISSHTYDEDSISESPRTQGLPSARAGSSVSSNYFPEDSRPSYLLHYHPDHDTTAFTTHVITSSGPRHVTALLDSQLEGNMVSIRFCQENDIDVEPLEVKDDSLVHLGDKIEQRVIGRATFQLQVSASRPNCLVAVSAFVIEHHGKPLFLGIPFARARERVLASRSPQGEPGEDPEKRLYHDVFSGKERNDSDEDPGISRRNPSAKSPNIKAEETPKYEIHTISGWMPLDAEVDYSVRGNIVSEEFCHQYRIQIRAPPPDSERMLGLALGFNASRTKFTLIGIADITINKSGDPSAREEKSTGEALVVGGSGRLLCIIGW
ncbi:hypothetical protein MKZ38_006175 [Zalerion maritima]|uniref:Fungal N-terminal domain-containing protein n=1 Tax=Zalerion maritima TaxID=339359 RepID=A0AAD5RJ81_9PEZI|nr:hypothetical protein MKZ38_006175 [Zalerion maritima]